MAAPWKSGVGTKGAADSVRWAIEVLSFVPQEGRIVPASGGLTEAEQQRRMALSILESIIEPEA